MLCFRSLPARIFQPVGFRCLLIRHDTTLLFGGLFLRKNTLLRLRGLLTSYFSHPLLLIRNVDITPPDRPSGPRFIAHPGRIEGLPHPGQFPLSLVNLPAGLHPVGWLQVSILQTAFCYRDSLRCSPQALFSSGPTVPLLFDEISVSPRLCLRLLPSLLVAPQGYLALWPLHGFPCRLMASQRSLSMPILKASFDLPLARPDDLYPPEVPCHPARAHCRVPRRINPWGEHMQAIFVQSMMVAVREMVLAGSPGNLTTTRRTTCMPVHPAEIRATTVHVILPHGEARHITSADDDRDYRCPRHTVSMHRLIKVVHRYEVVVGRRNIVGDVNTRIVFIHLVVERLRRQRSPSEIVVVLTPRYPRRSPVISRHPHPALLGEKNPATIVVNRPAEGLVREPGPALVGIHPATPGVGPPVWIGLQSQRLPDESIIASLKPLSESRELCKEDLMVASIEQGGRNRFLKSHRGLSGRSEVIIPRRLLNHDGPGNILKLSQIAWIGLNRLPIQVRIPFLKTTERNRELTTSLLEFCLECSLLALSLKLRDPFLQFSGLSISRELREIAGRQKARGGKSRQK